MGERLTKSDVEKIEKEIEERKLVQRPKLIGAVKEARAQGDLSENFEYYAAKRDKNKNEGRIRYLERMLKNAEVIDDSSNDGEIGINNRVVVYFPDDDEEETYKLVTSIRSDALVGMLSIECPLGKAIMGKKAGDTATVTLENGASYQVIIRSVVDSTDDADDEISSF